MEIFHFFLTLLWCAVAWQGSGSRTEMRDSVREEWRGIVERVCTRELYRSTRNATSRIDEGWNESKKDKEEGIGDARKTGRPEALFGDKRGIAKGLCRHGNPGNASWL